MRFMRPEVVAFILAVSATAACGGGSDRSSSPPPPSTRPATAVPTASADKNAYPVFPNADAGADPAVPAEQGGKGFKGDGWETNTTFDLIGDPRALKGGVFREAVYDFPGTLRIVGPESNSALNYMIGPMVYESLVSINPTTLDYFPALATHWQVSADKMNYRFRINPNARWSDGEPVVADDVVATWSFMMDKGLQAPMDQLVYAKFEKPIAESKYIVSVKSKQLNWRNFLYFGSSLAILPSHVLKNVDGARYLKEYNFKMLPGSGPYAVNESDVVKGKSVSIRRRTNYWGEKDRRNAGLYNFDEIREIVVRDQNLAFEMFKKGDLDDYYVNVSREWVEDLNFDKVQRGLILKRKIFNDAPSGFSGIAFNTRKAPFDDIRVRKALTFLMNRELLIEKLFFREYLPLNSYYAGGVYENPNNPRNPYNPQLALQLLAEAGWKDRDAQGRLVRNGQPLTVELQYADKGQERWMTVYQEDLRKVGIALNLRLVTPETAFKLVMERTFDTASEGWGALLFPNPETQFSSKLADVSNNNNITGFKDSHVDELLDVYDKEFDQKKRASIIREIDGILANAYHYALGWDAPFQRVAYWNKFGHPESYLTRIGDYKDMVSLWWLDPEQERQLTRALGENSVTLPAGETEVRYWKTYGASPQTAGTSAR